MRSPLLHWLARLPRHIEAASACMPCNHVGPHMFPLKQLSGTRWTHGGQHRSPMEVTPTQCARHSCSQLHRFHPVHRMSNLEKKQKEELQPLANFYSFVYNDSFFHSTHSYSFPFWNHSSVQINPSLLDLLPQSSFHTILAREINSPYFNSIKNNTPAPMWSTLPTLHNPPNCHALPRCAHFRPLGSRMKYNSHALVKPVQTLT